MGCVLMNILKLLVPFIGAAMLPAMPSMASVAMDGACLVNDSGTPQSYQMRWSDESRWYEIKVEPGKNWCHWRPAGTARLIVKRDGREQQPRLRTANCDSMSSCPGARNFARLSMRQLFPNPVQAVSGDTPTRGEAFAYCRKLISESMGCMTRACGPVARSLPPAREFCDNKVVNGYPKRVCEPNRNYDSDLADHRAWKSCAAPRSGECRWNIAERFIRDGGFAHDDCAAWYVKTAASDAPSGATGNRTRADGKPNAIPMSRWQSNRQRGKELSSRACQGDAEAARELRKLAMEDREATALVSYAAYLERENCGIGSKDFRFLTSLHREAAEAGYPIGMSNYGHRLVTGNGTDRDPRKGAMYLSGAARAGYPIAAVFLAEFLTDGKYLPRDLDRARQMLDFAAREGAPAKRVDRARNRLQSALGQKPKRQTAPAAPAQATIVVNTLTGRKIPVQLSLGDTVGDLKARVGKVEGIAPKQQRLIYEGKTLEDQATIKSYGIADGDAVTLVLKLR